MLKKVWAEGESERWESIQRLDVNFHLSLSLSALTPEGFLKILKTFGKILNFTNSGCYP